MSDYVDVWLVSGDARNLGKKEELNLGSGRIVIYRVDVEHAPPGTYRADLSLGDLALASIMFAKREALNDSLCMPISCTTFEGTAEARVMCVEGFGRKVCLRIYFFVVEDSK